MQTTTFKSEIKLRKAEQFLGSKQKRYFASGFKKIRCDLGNYQYLDDKLTASLKLNWGNDWSVKNSVQADRHMGSIESFSVAVRLLELFLIIKYNLTDQEIAESFIRKIEFKTKPCDHNDDRPLDVKVTNIQTEWINFNSTVGKFDIVVGNFQFVVEIGFQNRFSPVGFPYQRFSEAITSNPDQYYGRGYKSTSIDIENLVLNLETRIVTAVSKVKRSINNGSTGIGTSNLRGLTFIDFLSIAGQLTQILLYKLDNIIREESNNLWVRYLSAEFLAINPQSVVMSKAHFTEFNLVKMKGETWRLATAQFEIGSINGTVKVCHIINNKLP